ncbi:MAG: hypothetical protein CFE33_05505 [Pseudorhodobacter sp. PARRP1]|nr:MAG: hypothetical protein CFE33_05505 [Pseudorhodobacter sp. PARRP1]
MKSHGIPCFTKTERRDKKKQGRLKTPNKAKKTGSYRHPALPSLTDPARERADISPRWQAQQDAQRWDRRRTEQWQQLGPPFLFQGVAIPQKEPQGRW